MSINADSLEHVPAPLVLPDGYARHSPDRDALRNAIYQMAGAADWAALSWTELVEALLALGRTDIALGRLTEGHLDALRIADQAGGALETGALYGVWASRSGATGVRARRHGTRLVLTGTVKFASGAGVIDRALLPVWLEDDHHLLVDLDVADLPVDRSAWQTGAMTVSQSHTVGLDQLDVAAASVLGQPDFYLDRPGFFPGGVGVAAVWTGGLARVIDTVLGWLDERRSPAGDLRLGQLSTQRTLALATVRQGGQLLDAVLNPVQTAPTKAQLHQLATQVRAGVAAAVRAGLAEARLLAGPAGLAFDVDLTHAIDDLGLYVLQQNADADAAYLGETLRSR